MDTKLIRQFGQEILSYRLRTDRQRKRARIEDADKQLLAIHREQRDLWKQKRNIGWEPLVPPVQKGWKRTFVVREDIARGKQGALFEHILSKINTVDWSHRKDFREKKRLRGKKIYPVRGQALSRPSPDEFRRMEFSEREKEFFHREHGYYTWKKNGGLVSYFVFNEPWRFQLRVRPNMIDKVRKRDDVLEARMKELDNYLEKNLYRPRLIKLQGGYRRPWWDFDEKEWETNPLTNKSFSAILDLAKHMAGIQRTHDVDAAENREDRNRMEDVNNSRAGRGHTGGHTGAQE